MKARMTVKEITGRLQSWGRCRPFIGIISYPEEEDWGVSLSSSSNYFFNIWSHDRFRLHSLQIRTDCRRKIFQSRQHRYSALKRMHVCRTWEHQRLKSKNSNLKNGHRLSVVETAYRPSVLLLILRRLFQNTLSLGSYVPLSSTFTEIVVSFSTDRLLCASTPSSLPDKNKRLKHRISFPSSMLNWCQWYVNPK